MAAGRSSHKGLKICLGVSALFIIIVATVILTLAFTVFKPKDPDITVQLGGLENVEIITPTPNLTVTMGVNITIVNRNYAAFRYKNSTADINFHDTVVGHVPMETKYIPARSQINVTSSAGFVPGKLIGDPHFWADIGNGTLNLTSTATLPGKVIMFKMIKLKGAVSYSCNFTINIFSIAADSKCTSKISL